MNKPTVELLKMPCCGVSAFDFGVYLRETSASRHCELRDQVTRGSSPRRGLDGQGV